MTVSRRIAPLPASAALAFAVLAGVPTSAAADASPKRVMPEYDGLPDPPPTAGETALWVPRVILFPLYVVSEYVLRRPIGTVVATAERKNWVTAVVDFFTFGEEHNAGLVPTAFFDFGLRPSVGLYFFWDKAFVRDNAIRAHLSYFGSDWVATALSDRILIGNETTLSLDLGYLHRPDHVYAGEGARSLYADEGRYLDEQISLSSSVDARVSSLFTYHAKVGVDSHRFRPAAYDDPPLDVRVGEGRYPLPLGFEGYTSVFQSSELVLDTRQKSASTKSGVRVAAFVRHGSDVRHDPGASWVRYGGTAGGYLDLWHARVLGLTVSSEFADSVRGPLPFTEEVVWGGAEPLSGFLPGRLHGRSGLAAQAIYSWPIWIWLDGAIRTSVGNVFDTHLSDFSPRLLRLSSGIGVQSNGSPDHRLEVFVGVGSETFQQGGRIDSLRISVGGTNGF